MGWPEAIYGSVEAASLAAGVWAVCWLFAVLIRSEQCSCTEEDEDGEEI